jgi:uncharacterized protein (DUF486 family)
VIQSAAELAVAPCVLPLPSLPFYLVLEFSFNVDRPSSRPGADVSSSLLVVFWTTRRRERWATGMDTSYRQRWFQMVIVLGALYFVFGIAFAAFASWSASDSMRVTWNRLGFLISAVAFTFHICYEHFRLRNSPLITASHVSIAVALGAFALAVNANVHGYRVGSSNKRLLAFALIAWPAITAVPAFAVALLAAVGLALRRWTT